MRNPKIIHELLSQLDTGKHTAVYRHTNSDICAKNEFPNICALVLSDQMCFAWPFTWPKKLEELDATTSKSKSAK